MKTYLCGGINELSDSACCDWRAVAKSLLRTETLDPMRRDYRGREGDFTNEIIEILKGSDAREFDRTAIEKLFEIQRRTALLLIQQAGATKSGVRHVVTRKALLAWVQHIEATEAQDLERRQQVAVQLDEQMAEQKAMQVALRQAGKPPVEFPLTREILEATLDSLPPDIHITPGRIMINFRPDDPLQACQMLYALGLVLANDFDSFAKIMQADSATKL
jgi:hypothetical protein